ncbi:hypothetical protein [Rhodopirellula sp. MGV]|uniref:hypothetical protein n=1 Tax=Rhodopirellula sp. MGV TaxID=2023130 RepID=UPI000B974EC9|nr:hypothetical protein [Rhodopirellula sp. MGV]OYP29815.1 hypothetical protein CGZ80_23760 [Rhodopirellula sp. MGV]PNY33697.1 hypothetical protein C2E31_26740 [Rhodopirellula baltica]
MSRRRGGGVSVGHDAFLDIVANLVGILIILVVVLGAQSHSVIQEAIQESETPTNPELREATDSDMDQLAVMAAEAASAQTESRRLEKTIKSLEARVERESERRTVLLALLTQAEEAMQAKQETMDAEKMEIAKAEAKAQSLKRQLEELDATEDELRSRQPKVVEIENLPTPMAKTVFGKEVYFRLKGNRLSVIPFEELAEEIGRDFRRTSGSSSREGVSDSAVGPVRGYVARYVMNRSNELVSDGGKIARMTRARVMVASFEPLREPHGEPIDQVLSNDDWLDIELTGYSPESSTITVAVYPDSYGAFRKLREKFYAKGFAIAARPIKDGAPIYVNFAGGGSRSSAQ